LRVKACINEQYVLVPAVLKLPLLLFVGMLYLLTNI